MVYRTHLSGGLRDDQEFRSDEERGVSDIFTILLLMSFMDTSNHLLIWISVRLVNLVNKADPLCVGQRVLAFGAHHTVLGADCGMQPGCVKRPLTVLKTTDYLAKINVTTREWD